MTNQQLYQVVETGTTISKEVTDIFLEMDSTASVSTQTELNQLMVKLYKRMSKEKIVVELFGEEPCAPEVFKKWVEDEMDNYTVGLFLKDVG
ncbi:MAG: hypothetical protein IJ679_03150 [Lachnospiraceae bacterium]|nr:hypothetical protein [Lachnospiraceae bacterium]